MDTNEKCPHCGAIRVEGREYACGFVFRVGVKNNPRPHECLLNSEVSAHAATREREKSTSIAFGVMKLTAEGWESECKKVAQELTETKRKLGAIHRRLSGEETESCPLCAEMRPTGEPQRIPMCHVCTLESNLEATKRELDERKAENKRWQSLAFGKIQSTSDELKRLTIAEARVRELEGLAIGNQESGDGGLWVEVFIPIERLGGANCEGEECPTLGDAIPRKEEK